MMNTTQQRKHILTVMIFLLSKSKQLANIKDPFKVRTNNSTLPKKSLISISSLKTPFGDSNDIQSSLTENKIDVTRKSSSEETLEKKESKKFYGKKIEENCFSINKLNSSITIEKFVNRISSFEGFSDNQLQLAVYYFTYILTTYGKLITKQANFEFRLFAGCLYLSHRIQEDINYLHKDMGKIFGIPPKKLSDIANKTLELVSGSGAKLMNSPLETFWAKAVVFVQNGKLEQSVTSNLLSQN